MPEWWSRVRDWLEHGDETALDPSTMVEVASVNFAISEVIVTRLEETGIQALSLEQRFAGMSGMPTARILCPAGRLAEARRIVDDILTQNK